MLTNENYINLVHKFKLAITARRTQIQNEKFKITYSANNRLINANLDLKLPNNNFQKTTKPKNFSSIFSKPFLSFLQVFWQPLAHTASSCSRQQQQYQLTEVHIAHPQSKDLKSEVGLLRHVQEQELGLCSYFSIVGAHNQKEQ